jgi:hypothetical protein
MKKLFTIYSIDNKISFYYFIINKNYIKMIVYFNSSFIPQEKVIISPFDRGFLFGDGVYEAMRTYNKKIFCFDEHLRRLKRSLQR